MDLKAWKTKNKYAKKYTHFDCRVSLDRVWNYINNTQNIASHSFFPFIHYTLRFKKYSKDKGVTYKEREICYAAHIDRYVYSYYGYKLNNLYNERVIKDNINNSSIAYRDNIGKSNIHFAKEAIDFIRNSENSYIMIGDFTKFFDSLDHNYLKRMICNLIGVGRLPKDYYTIYKNITKYAIWKLEDLLTYKKLQNSKTGISEFNQLKYALSKQEFKKLKSKYIETNTNFYGIPQGSPISAILSNIYMLDFDKLINDYVIKNSGLYMRYSDDFIVIFPQCPIEQFTEHYNFIKSIISIVPNLQLETSKTQVFNYDSGVVKNCNQNVLGNVMNGINIINYLGFSFDGSNVSIRDKTLSKYYYRMYRKLKTIVKGRDNGNKVSSHNLYQTYSIKGANSGNGNFLTYVKRAENVFKNEKRISQVNKTHMQKIKKRLKARV